MNRRFVAAVCAVVASLSAPHAFAGDPAAGETVFHQCAICHSAEPGKNKVGPSLFGVVGRKAATIDGYAYSQAMKSSGLTWDVPTLTKYLANPRGVVPGTKMTFSGIKDPHQLDDLLAYLGTLKK